MTMSAEKIDNLHWLRAMDDVAEEDGYLETLGARHWAFFYDDSPTLLVTFEQAADIRARPDKMPAGYAIAKAHGWSHLCLIAEGPTWYRDQRVYGYFDRLVDDGFLEDFDQVAFFGVGMSGYAAAAFAVTAPGAAVILVSPRATQDPAIAGWDRRDMAARRMNFSDRYGYAPDMTEGAGRVYLIHDPEHAPDAMHASLFARPWTTILNARHTGELLGARLSVQKLVEPILESALAGQLTTGSFARLWRKRHRDPAYLRLLAGRANARGQTARAIRICREGLKRATSPALTKLLGQLTGAG